MWARQTDAALFVGIKPWSRDWPRLGMVTVAEMQAVVRADQQRHNRTVRLAAWIVAHIPLAVFLGIQGGLGGDMKKLLRRFGMKDLLKAAPDYDGKVDEGA